MLVLREIGLPLNALSRLVRLIIRKQALRVNVCMYTLYFVIKTCSRLETGLPA